MKTPIAKSRYTASRAILHSTLFLCVSMSTLAFAIDGGRFATSKDPVSAFAVLIEFETANGKHTCSGSLISQNLVA